MSGTTMRQHNLALIQARLTPDVLGIFFPDWHATPAHPFFKRLMRELEVDATVHIGPPDAAVWSEDGIDGVLDRVMLERPHDEPAREPEEAHTQVDPLLPSASASAHSLPSSDADTWATHMHSDSALMTDDAVASPSPNEHGTVWPANASGAGANSGPCHVGSADAQAHATGIDELEEGEIPSTSVSSSAVPAAAAAAASSASASASSIPASSAPPTAHSLLSSSLSFERGRICFHFRTPLRPGLTFPRNSTSLSQGVLGEVHGESDDQQELETRLQWDGAPEPRSDLSPAADLHALLEALSAARVLRLDQLLFVARELASPSTVILQCRSMFPVEMRSVLGSASERDLRVHPWCELRVAELNARCARKARESLCGYHWSMGCVKPKGIRCNASHDPAMARLLVSRAGGIVRDGGEGESAPATDRETVPRSRSPRSRSHSRSTATRDHARQVRSRSRSRSHSRSHSHGRSHARRVERHDISRGRSRSHSRERRRSSHRGSRSRSHTRNRSRSRSRSRDRHEGRQSRHRRSRSPPAHHDASVSSVDDERAPLSASIGSNELIFHFRMALRPALHFRPDGSPASSQLQRIDSDTSDQQLIQRRLFLSGLPERPAGAPSAESASAELEELRALVSDLIDKQVLRQGEVEWIARCDGQGSLGQGQASGTCAVLQVSPSCAIVPLLSAAHRNLARYESKLALRPWAEFEWTRFHAAYATIAKDRLCSSFLVRIAGKHRCRRAECPFAHDVAGVQELVERSVRWCGRGRVEAAAKPVHPRPRRHRSPSPGQSSRQPDWRGHSDMHDRSRSDSMRASSPRRPVSVGPSSSSPAAAAAASAAPRAPDPDLSVPLHHFCVPLLLGLEYPLTACTPLFSSSSNAPAAGARPRPRAGPGAGLSAEGVLRQIDSDTWDPFLLQNRLELSGLPPLAADASQAELRQDLAHIVDELSNHAIFHRWRVQWIARVAPSPSLRQSHSTRAVVQFWPFMDAIVASLAMLRHRTIPGCPWMMLAWEDAECGRLNGLVPKSAPHERICRKFFCRPKGRLWCHAVDCRFSHELDALRLLQRRANGGVEVSPPPHAGAAALVPASEPLFEFSEPLRPALVFAPSDTLAEQGCLQVVDGRSSDPAVLSRRLVLTHQALTMSAPSDSEEAVRADLAHVIRELQQRGVLQCADIEWIARGARCDPGHGVGGAALPAATSSSHPQDPAPPIFLQLRAGAELGVLTRAIAASVPLARWVERACATELATLLQTLDQYNKEPRDLCGPYIVSLAGGRPCADAGACRMLHSEQDYRRLRLRVRYLERVLDAHPPADMAASHVEADQPMSVPVPTHAAAAGASQPASTPVAAPPPVVPPLPSTELASLPPGTFVFDLPLTLALMEPASRGAGQPHDQRPRALALQPIDGRSIDRHELDRRFVWAGRPAPAPTSAAVQSASSDSQALEADLRAAAEELESRGVVAMADIQWLARVVEAGHESGPPRLVLQLKPSVDLASVEKRAFALFWHRLRCFPLARLYELNQLALSAREPWSCVCTYFFAQLTSGRGCKYGGGCNRSHDPNVLARLMHRRALMQEPSRTGASASASASAMRGMPHNSDTKEVGMEVCAETSPAAVPPADSTHSPVAAAASTASAGTASSPSAPAVGAYGDKPTTSAAVDAHATSAPSAARAAPAPAEYVAADVTMEQRPEEPSEPAPSQPAAYLHAGDAAGATTPAQNVSMQLKLDPPPSAQAPAGTAQPQPSVDVSEQRGMPPGQQLSGVPLAFSSVRPSQLPPPDSLVASALPAGAAHPHRAHYPLGALTFSPGLQPAELVSAPPSSPLPASLVPLSLLIEAECKFGSGAQTLLQLTPEQRREDASEWVEDLTEMGVLTRDTPLAFAYRTSQAEGTEFLQLFFHSQEARERIRERYEAAAQETAAEA